jgi:hypothetical protein
MVDKMTFLQAEALMDLVANGTTGPIPAIPSISMEEDGITLRVYYSDAHWYTFLPDGQWNEYHYDERVGYGDPSLPSE